MVSVPFSYSVRKLKELDRCTVHQRAFHSMKLCSSIRVSYPALYAGT